MVSSNTMEEFKRDVSYHVSRSDGQIVLSAKLTDRFHDIRIEILADCESLKIVSARVNFISCPTADCPTVALRMERMVGLIIGRGLNLKVQEVFGGGEGCGNVRVMLLGLLPLAINVKAAAGFTDEQEMLDSIREKLTGSCAGYVKSQ